MIAHQAAMPTATNGTTNGTPASASAKPVATTPPRRPGTCLILGPWQHSRHLLRLWRELFDARGPDAARWPGSMSGRHEVADKVRELAPDVGGEQPYNEGVAAAAHRDQVRRPKAISEALSARVRRILDALRSAEEEEPGSDPPKVAIPRLVRWTAGPGRGGIFDLTVSADDQAVTICGLSGSALLSYAVIRARALEEGLLLPMQIAASDDSGSATSDEEDDDETESKTAKTTEKRKGSWLALVAEAQKREVVERLAAGEDLVDALVDALRRVLAEAPRAHDVSGLERGHVLEEPDRLLVRYSAILRAVHRALPDEKFGRESVVRAARVLGLVGRPTLNGSRPGGVWGFPISALASDREDEPPAQGLVRRHVDVPDAAVPDAVGPDAPVPEAGEVDGPEVDDPEEDPDSDLDAHGPEYVRDPEMEGDVYEPEEVE